MEAFTYTCFHLAEVNYQYLIKMKEFSRVVLTLTGKLAGIDRYLFFVHPAVHKIASPDAALCTARCTTLHPCMHKKRALLFTLLPCPSYRRWPKPM